MERSSQAVKTRSGVIGEAEGALEGEGFLSRTLDNLRRHEPSAKKCWRQCATVRKYNRILPFAFRTSLEIEFDAKSFAAVIVETPPSVYYKPRPTFSFGFGFGHDHHSIGHDSGRHGGHH